MNVLIINSSPRNELSLTKILLSSFAEGIVESGGNVKTFDLYKKNIRLCTACSSCYTSSQGKCVLTDDISVEIFPEFLKADLLVLGTPVYFGSLNAAMKNFIDRLLPFLDSRQEILEDGSFNHPFRRQLPKVVLFSVAGWQKEHAFNHISEYFRWLFKDKLIAEIYRGTSDLMMFCNTYKDKKSEIISAVKQAGIDVVKSGKISNDLIDIISQDLAPMELVVGSYNLFVSSCRHESKTLSQWVANSRLTWPESIEDLLTMMRLSFNKKAAADKSFKIQFVFGGQVEEHCYVNVEEGKLMSGEGDIENPSITIKAPFHLWIDVLYGRANIQQELMQGRLFIKGDFSIIFKLSEVFIAA